MSPEIEIKFLLDSNGNPLVIQHGSLNHYKIGISIKNIPDDVYAVTYQLDKSYKNPFREERNKEGNFRFETTTFGDYSISATLLGKKQNYVVSNILSRALRQSYNESLNSSLDQAINNIVKH